MADDDATNDEGDISQLLSQQSKLLSEVRKSRGWDTIARAFNVFDQERRPLRWRVLRIGSQVALIGIGIASALFVQYVTADSTPSTRQWVALILLAVPSAAVYLAYLWETF